LRSTSRPTERIRGARPRLGRAVRPEPLGVDAGGHQRHAGPRHAELDQLADLVLALHDRPVDARPSSRSYADPARGLVSAAPW
jgi:hypothetical protein